MTSPDGQAHPQTASISWTSTGKTIIVYFYNPPYHVYFIGSNLPPASVVNMTFNGIKKSATSDSLGDVAINYLDVQNGTYTFTVGAFAGRMA